MENETINRIKSAIQAYYAGNQIMDDEEYEELIASSGLSQFDLEKIKRQSILVIDKIKHKHPMGTLPKVHSMEEVKTSGDAIYQAKYDGCSIEIHHDADGKMDYACTRGDYTYGENRTDLVHELINLGKIKIDDSIKNASVRGELVISNEDWKLLDGEFKNQRNAAAGIANRNDLSYVKFLTFIPYDVVIDDSGDTQLYVGTDEAPHWSSFEEAESNTFKLGVPTDGIVIKQYEDGKQTSAQAYKFSDKTYKTRIRDVKWQLGRTGKLTPVAEFDTVFIDAEVSRASLGSYAIFEHLDLHYDDEIEVKKANMIIPQVIRNLGGGSSVKIMPPKWWNGKKTRIDGAHLYGFNDDQWRSTLYSQVNSLAAKGISNAFVDKCIEAYGVTCLEDLIEVVRREDFKVEGVGATMKKKALDCIDSIGNCTMTAFLSALAINGLGWKSMEKIVAKAKSEAGQLNVDATDYFLDIQSPYEFAYAISGLGHSAASAFKENFDMIVEQLNSFDTAFGHYPKFDNAVSAPDGPEVVVTGKFNDGLKRGDIEKLLRDNSFKVSGKVTKSTAHLIAGIGGGSKRSAAEALGIDIIETNGDINVALNQLKADEQNGEE